jgi:hypothetical protein
LEYLLEPISTILVKEASAEPKSPTLQLISPCMQRYLVSKQGSFFETIKSKHSSFRWTKSILVFVHSVQLHLIVLLINLNGNLEFKIEIKG